MFSSKIRLKYDNKSLIEYKLLIEYILFNQNNEFISNYNSKYNLSNFKLYKENARLNEFYIKNNFFLSTNYIIEPPIESYIESKYLEYKINALFNNNLIKTNFKDKNGEYEHQRLDTNFINYKIEARNNLN